jgi:D-alanine-D-alanine ligase
MSLFSKIKVAVLRGGPSHGYDSSLKSGEYILSHLRNKTDKYEPIDVFISRDGEWHLSGFVREPLNALKHADLVWNALHSSYGEDGQVQRILESLRIPYTGSNAVSSALAFNKEIAKGVYDKLSFSTPKHEVVTNDPSLEENLVRIFRTYLHPVVVKPANRNLGLGVRFAHSYNDLKNYVEENLGHSSKVLIEEMIKGKTASCVVVDNARGERTYAFMPVEVVGEGEYRSPGNFTLEERNNITEMAKQAHHALGMRHYSSSDFIITPKGKVYILETNSQPVMHKDSLIESSLEAAGWPAHDFIDHVVSLALNKNLR